ncbi:MAG: bacteriohemerythrin [Spirochaetaceae bacterium]|jgi:hemerythrin|nr:bacteriohemerythrin [Spirochaetaceae bacterium]
MEEIFIKWEERYAVGIALIDEQHKQLIDLTNALYAACRQGEAVARMHFGDALRSAVDYVAFHFSTEEQIMERIRYPDFLAHKREHENFVKKVLKDKKDFEEGKSFVSHGFVRFLRDWILSHIAVSDKLFVDYIMRLKRDGVLDLPQ